MSSARNHFISHCPPDPANPISGALNASRVLFQLVICVTLSGCFTQPPDTQIEHSIQGLYDADLSSSGKYALVASIRHGASFWRLSDGERLYNWNHVAQGFSSIDHTVLADTGERGFTATNRELVAWDSKTGQPLQYWQLPDRITCLAANRTGSHALVAMDSGQAMVVDVVQAGFVWTAYFNETVTACDLASSNGFVAIGTQAGDLSLLKVLNTDVDASEPSASWQAQTILNHHHDHALYKVRIFADSNIVLSASRHHELKIHEIQSQKLLHTLPLKSLNISHSIMQKDMLIVADSHLRIRFIDTDQWQVRHTLKIPKRNAWKPSGTFIAAMAFAQNQLTVTTSDGISHIYKDIPQITP